jgi:tetratricopeptide (TPR) repeat protein
MGHMHFYNLEYDEALSAFRSDIAANPLKPDGYNHLAQAVLYRALFRSGILENSLVSGDDFLLSLIRQQKLTLSTADDSEFQDAVGKAVSSSQALLRVDPNDTGALFALGAAYGLRANYSFLVKKSWVSAMRESTAARKLHNRVVELDPANVDARMLQGVQDYIVGSLPVAMRFLGAVAGIRGDKEAGVFALQQVAARGTRNNVDAQMLLATFYRHEQKPWTAMAYIYRLRQAFPRNYLLHFAEIYTNIELRDERAAWESLHSLESSRRAGIPGYAMIQPAKLSYAKGVIECRFGHLDRALEEMARVAQSGDSGDERTRLQAYERVGMINDLRGQRRLAVQAYQMVVSSAPDSEIARESQKYLSRPFQRKAAD